MNPHIRDVRFHGASVECGLPVDPESSYAINRSYFFHFRTMYRGHLAIKGPDHPDVLFYFQQLSFYASCLISATASNAPAHGKRSAGAGAGRAGAFSAARASLASPDGNHGENNSSAVDKSLFAGVTE